MSPKVLMISQKIYYYLNFKKNSPKGNIKKEIIGEVVGFYKEDNSEAVNLVCNLTGENSMGQCLLELKQVYFKILVLAL